jgi:hypothetical protein
MGVVIASGVAARDPVLHPGMRTGAVYYFGATVLPSATTAAVSANAFYCQPISVVGTINRIGIEVTTGSAGLCRLGLYTNLNGLPGSLVLDAGTVDTTNIAVVEATIADMVMRGDWFWMGAVFNATPTVRVGTVGAAMLGGANTTSAGARCLTGAFAYAALPATAPTISGVSSVGPAIFLRSA